MLRFLYVTDLHGWEEAYELVLNVAREREIDTIVNGGDILPKGGSLHKSLARPSATGGLPEVFAIQEEFISDFFVDYFGRCETFGVSNFVTFGNDDLRCHFKKWQHVISQFDHVFELSVAWHQLGKQYFSKKEYQKALAAFDFAIISDDLFIGAYIEKGKVLESV